MRGLEGSIQMCRVGKRAQSWRVERVVETGARPGREMMGVRRKVRSLVRVRVAMVVV